MNNNRKRIIIVGATSAIAEHCARQWVQEQPVMLTLIGRDSVRVSRVADDLRIRSPESDIQIVTAEFLDPVAIQATVDYITSQGSVDIVLIAHGFLPDQIECQNDLQACHRALEVNGISPVVYAEAFAKQMAKDNYGTLALIGSVAGDRGRKSNYVYGAAKGLITRYAQGLQHRLAGTAVRVVLIKPGPTDTPMTAHFKDRGVKLAPVENVSKKICLAIEAGQAVVYVPGKWRTIMLVIRHLPSFVFNNMDI